MFDILIVTYSVIAAIIGAGFASGQEMLLYFVRFHKYGAVGIAVTVVAFTVFVYAVLSVCIKNKYSDLDGFLSMFKKRAVQRFVKAVTLAFSFSVYGAMLSASGELIYATIGISPALGSLICAILSAVVFCRCGDRVFTANAGLGIVLVPLITFSALYMLFYREYHVFAPQAVPAVCDGLVYAGYNLVSLTPVLVSLSKRLRSRGDAVSAALSVGVISGVIMLVIFVLISIYAGKIPLGELPMLTLARRQSSAFGGVYCAVLATAVVTTLISSGGGICDALSLKGKPLKTAILAVSAYLLSSFGFSGLIDVLYRLCGTVGLFVCVAIMYASVHGVRRKNNCKKDKFKRIISKINV